MLPDGFARDTNGGQPMGLFSTAAMKELKKQAELIGSLHGDAYVGTMQWADVADVVANKDFQTRLRGAFDAASRDVGEKKALKAALSTAKNYAEAAPYVRSLPLGNVGRDAEKAIRQMLGVPT
jgi:hypothetical protein